MRLVPFLSLCYIALSHDVEVVDPVEALNEPVRLLGKLDDLKALHEKQKSEAKILFDQFNSEKNVDKAKEIKKKLDAAEAAARQTQRDIRNMSGDDDSSAAAGDKSGKNLKDQVKERAEDRDADGNMEALDLANEDLKTGGRTAGDKAKKAVDGTVTGAKKAGTRVKHEIKDAGDAMADEAIKAGESVKSGALAVGNAAVNASLGVKNAVKNAGTNSQIAAQNAGDAIGDKATEIKHGVADGISSVGHHIKKGGEHVVNGIKTAGDAVHVAAVNTGDFIGDSATNMRNSITSGLAGGFGALGHSLSHLGSHMGDMIARPKSLGLDWWKALIAVLGTSVLVSLFASIWELTGMGKKHAYAIDDMEPHFVNPPENISGDTVIPAATIGAVTTQTETTEPIVGQTSLEQSASVAVPVVTEPTIIEQAVPAPENAAVVTVNPVNAGSITVTPESAEANQGINALREKFNRAD